MMGRAGIPIEVSGHLAWILCIVAGSDGLTAIVEFTPDVEGLVSFGVAIPAKLYTREELIRTVTKGAEKRLEEHIKRAEEERAQRSEEERLKKLAEEVSRMVGL